MATKDSIRASIIGAKDTALQAVDVPEWNTTVHIKVMSGADRDEFEGEANKGGTVNHDNLRAKLLVKVLCDETGERLFQDQEYIELGKKSSVVLVRLFDIAAKHTAFR